MFGGSSRLATYHSCCAQSKEYLKFTFELRTCIFEGYIPRRSGQPFPVTAKAEYKTYRGLMEPQGHKIPCNFRPEQVHEVDPL